MESVTIEFIKNGQPLYMQLYNYIKNEIKTGKTKPNEKLPSKRFLSNELGISVNTIESAYSQLEAEGYIESKSRSGFYVCQLDEIRISKSTIEFKEEKGVEEKFRYSFSTNNVDTDFFPYATWSKISKKLMYNNREFLELGNSKGDYELRETLCNFFHQTRGVNCTPDQIIIGAGSEYLIGIIVNLIGKDKLYAMENPCYSKTYNIIKNNSIGVDLIDVNSKGISIDSLRHSKCKCVHITPSHQFPMGAIMPMSRRTQLLNWANENDKYIIEDDYDSEFRFTGRPIPSLQGLDRNSRVIYLTTFSKSISPSFRLSVLILPPQLIEKYNSEYSYYSSTVSRYEQHTLSEFISESHFERHLNKLRKIYKSRKETLEREIKKINDCAEIIGSNAGLHFIVNFPNKSEEYLVTSAKRLGIKVNGLSEYFIDNKENCPEGAVVLGFAALSEQEIVDACEILSDVWS